MNQNETHEGAPRLLDERELADMLGLSVSTIRNWRWKGTGVPWLKVGSRVRYDRRDVERYLEESRRSA